MPKKPTTWILVADGSRARILVTKGPGQGLEVVAEREVELARSHDLGSDRPGRSYESATTGRHAIEPRVDLHREQKAHFAYGLIDFLDAELKSGKFQHLVVVAPPGTLGDLRHHISGPLAALVTAEIDKDLTKVPLHDLPGHLRDVVRC